MQKPVHPGDPANSNTTADPVAPFMPQSGELAAAIERDEASPQPPLIEIPPEPVAAEPLETASFPPPKPPRRLKLRTLAHLAAALQMLTRFRFFQSRNWPADIYRESIAWFPAIGILVGTLGAAVDGFGNYIGLTPFVTAPLAVAAMIWLTGGRHEGGLANFADGLGGAEERETQLRIMNDSRIGTYGTLALSLMLLTRVGTLASFSSSAYVFAGLVSAGAASRAIMPAIAAWLGPVDRDDAAAVLAAPSGLRLMAGLIIAALLPLILIDPVAGLAMLAAGAGAAVLVAWLAKRELGGFTRDVLSAVQQCSELAMLVTLVAAQD